jgi:hypothetical protein
MECLILHGPIPSVVRGFDGRFSVISVFLVFLEQCTKGLVMKAYIPKSWRGFAKRLEPVSYATEPLKPQKLGTVGAASVGKDAGLLTVQQFYDRLVATGQTCFTLAELSEQCRLEQNVPSGSIELRGVIAALMRAGRIVPGQRGRGDGTPVADKVFAVADELDFS